MLACTREVPKVKFRTMGDAQGQDEATIAVMAAADRMFDFLLVSSNDYLGALETLGQSEVRAVMRSVKGE